MEFTFTVGYLIETAILVAGAGGIIYFLIRSPSTLMLKSSSTVKPSSKLNKYMAAGVIFTTIGLVLALNAVSHLTSEVAGKPAATSCDSPFTINKSVDCYVRWHKVVRVCMGNGGGNNCIAGADAHYDCDTYNAMGGGGPKTSDILANRFCGYTDNGARKVSPHNIAVYQNNDGGQCGWTGFQVTCN